MTGPTGAQGVVQSFAITARPTGTIQIINNTSLDVPEFYNGSKFSNITTVIITNIQSTIPITAGTYIMTAGTPPVGITLGDIFYWNGTTATLAYTYTNAPIVVQLGTGTSAQLVRKVNGSWLLDSVFTSITLTNLPQTTADEPIIPVVFNSAAKRFETPGFIADYGMVLDNTLLSPPVSPRVGDSYLVPVGASGAWVGLDTGLVSWTGSYWDYNPPVGNAQVTVTSGVNTGMVLHYVASTATWITNTTFGIHMPQNAVNTGPVNKGLLYQDATNNTIDSLLAITQPVPLNFIQVRAILARTLTSSDLAGLYIQTAGVLPTIMGGSNPIGYNDVIYWNAATQTAWCKYAYANTPGVIGVGIDAVVNIATKYAGTWGMLGTGQGMDTPVGIINEYGGTIAPMGNLFCDGASYLRSDYPQLFSVIGTAFGSVDSTHFNVPDMRGIFARGVDGTAGNDPDKTSRTAIKPGGNIGNMVGSYETDAFQGHWHNASMAPIGAGGGGAGVIWTPEQTYSTTVQDPIADATHGTPRIGYETRPKNININYIIKATTFATNQSGAAMTPTAAYIPTFGGLTVTSSQFFWQRFNDHIYVYGTFNVNVTTGANLTVGLPTGLSLNTSAWAASGYMLCGSGIWSGNGSIGGRVYQAIAAGANPNEIFITASSATIPETITPVAANLIVSTGQTLQVEFRLPIAQWSGASTGGLLTTMNVQSANFTATANTIYPVNTSTTAITVTLPATPLVGAQVTLIDYYGTFNTNTMTVGFNGALYNGTLTTQICALARTTITFVYIDNIQGWKVTNYSTGP